MEYKVRLLDGAETKSVQQVEEELLQKHEQEVNSDKIDGLMHMPIKMRNEAKIQKNYSVSDQIRNELSSIGIELKDGKDGSSYTLN